MPVGTTCCGTAGDRGLLHPELIASATREEKAGLDETPAQAYLSANRTCEWACARPPAARMNCSCSCRRN